jgi:hypothetical protein
MAAHKTTWQKRGPSFFISSSGLILSPEFLLGEPNCGDEPQKNSQCGKNLEMP